MAPQQAKMALKVLDERIRRYMPAYVTPRSRGKGLRAWIDAPFMLEPGRTEQVPNWLCNGILPVRRRGRSFPESPAWSRPRKSRSIS